MEDKKKKGKGLKIFLVIFIILFLLAGGVLGYGYVKYKDLENVNTNLNTKNKNLSNDLEKTKKELESVNKDLEKTEKEVNDSFSSDYAYRLKNVSCVYNNNICTKTIKVKYDGKNHEIKIKKEVKIKELSSNNDEDSYEVKYTYNIYEDNNLIDTIKSKPWDPVSYSEPFISDVDFDGYLYVFNGKYLGVLLSGFRGGYDLTLYNNGKRVDKVIVTVSGQGFGNKKQTVSNGIDYIKFDGSKLNYWYIMCSNSQKAVNVDLTFDGNKASIKAGTTEKVEGGGAGGCFNTKTNKYE